MRQLTDGTRQLTLAQAYEPFGDPRLAAGQDTTPYAFTGEWTDGAGLVHLRARYYQPEVGRFFQVDPWRGDLDRPQSLSPYAYVGNNPLTLSDPSGRCYPPLQWLRHVPPDDVLCEYMDMAAFITGAPMATPGEKNLARIYIGGWALAHSLLIVAAGFYAAGTAIAAAEIAPAIGTWALEGIIGAKTFGEATTLIATTLASSSFLQAIGIGGEAYLTYQAVACGNEDAAAILISGFLLTGQSLVQNGLQRAFSRVASELNAVLHHVQADRILMPGGRPIGSSSGDPRIITVQTRQEMQRIFDELTVGKMPGTWHNYPGPNYLVPGWGEVGWRESIRYGPTIDVQIPGILIDKIHLPR